MECAACSGLGRHIVTTFLGPTIEFCRDCDGAGKVPELAAVDVAAAESDPWEEWVDIGGESGGA